MPAWVWIVLGAMAVLVVMHEVAHRYAKKNPSACPSFLSFELFLLELPIVRSWLGGEAIVSKVGAQPGMSILEIGCGPGRITVPLAKAVAPGGHVVAIDMQQAMLDKLRKRLTRERIENVEPRQGALGVGKLAPRETFDREVLVAVLGEIPDKLAAIRECLSSLKPGGILSVTEMKPDPHFQTEERVSTLVKEAGFEVIETYRNRFAFTMNCGKPASNKTAGGDA